MQNDTPLENQAADGRTTRRSHRLSRPLGLALLAVPVVATAGAFGVPALAASGTPAARPLAATAPAAAAAQGQGQETLTAEQAAKLLKDKRAGLAAPSAAASTSASSEEKALDAFFSHGNDYDDALRLAKLWNAPVVGGDLGQVKVAAGLNLLAGRPIDALPQGLASRATLDAAFVQAGYDHDDAVLLARLWGQGLSPADAEARAGQKLLGHLALPIRHGQTAATVSADAAMEAFFDNGYDGDDAKRLAAAWHTGSANGDLSEVKAAAGRKILAGIPLPVAHH